MNASTLQANDWPRSHDDVCAPRAGARTTRTRILDVELFHQEAGNGRPLVLLHGINDSHRTWKQVLPALAQSRRVLALDLPGCGLSGRPDASYSLDWQARVVIAWLQALGLDQVDMAGHSYGGGVAQQMLLVEPQRIRRLALVAAGGLGREVSPRLKLASLPLLLELLGQPFLAPSVARVLHWLGVLASEDERRWYCEVNTQPGTARALARTVRDVVDWRGQTRHFLDRAAEIQRFPPIALFWCSEDPIIPHAQAVATLATLEGAQITTVDGCGHFPHHEQPEAFVRALAGFLDAELAIPVRCVPPRTQTSPALAARLYMRLCSALAAPVQQTMSERTLRTSR